MAENEGSTITRREEILAAAADIFWEKGYHATSMNDLADAMMMRKASLYHHIESKETLLYEISVSSMLHIIDAAANASASAIGVDPEQHLRNIIFSHLTALLADRTRHATALFELRSLSDVQRKHVVDLRSRYDQMIDDAVHAVQVSTGRWPGTSTKIVRMAMLGMLNWTSIWFSNRGAETPQAIAEGFYRILMPPLHAPVARPAP